MKRFSVATAAVVGVGASLMLSLVLAMGCAPGGAVTAMPAPST